MVCKHPTKRTGIEETLRRLLPVLQRETAVGFGSKRFFFPFQAEVLMSMLEATDARRREETSLVLDESYLLCLIISNIPVKLCELTATLNAAYGGEFSNGHVQTDTSLLCSDRTPAFFSSRFHNVGRMLGALGSHCAITEHQPLELPESSYEDARMALLALCQSVLQSLQKSSALLSRFQRAPDYVGPTPMDLQSKSYCAWIYIDECKYKQAVVRSGTNLHVQVPYAAITHCVRHLVLSNCSLVALPSALCILFQVEVLDVRNNPLIVIELAKVLNIWREKSWYPALRLNCFESQSAQDVWDSCGECPCEFLGKPNFFGDCHDMPLEDADLPELDRHLSDPFPHRPWRTREAQSGPPSLRATLFRPSKDEAKGELIEIVDDSGS